MPQPFVDAASASDISSYGAALCCVYTRIASTGSTNPIWMQRMDGSNIEIAGTTFAAVAQNAYEKGCGMKLGAQDCRSKETCVNNAMAIQDQPEAEPEAGPEQSSCRDTKKGRKPCKVKKCRKKKKKFPNGKLRKKYAEKCMKTCGQCH